MTEKISIELYKDLVNSNKNGLALETAMKNAFEINKVSSIRWFEELSRSEKAHWFSIENTLFDLLPFITQKNKKLGARIFQNLLEPQFDEFPSIIPYEKTYKFSNTNRTDLWMATEKLPMLFEIASKEFTKTVLELTLKYHNIPLQKRRKKTYDVVSQIWYHDDSHDQITKLLKIIEVKSRSLASKNNPKLLKIIQYLDSVNYTISIRLKANILSANPKVFSKDLFDMLESIIKNYDCMDLFPIIVSKIHPFLTKIQIKKLNKFAFSDMLNNSIRDQDSFRRFVISSIPSNLRSIEAQKWLKNNRSPNMTFRQRPIVFKSISKKSQEEKKNFEKLSDAEQELDIIELINNFEKFNTNEKKIEFLKNVDIYLNKERKRVNKEIVFQLEPIIYEYCSDQDPKKENSQHIDYDGDLLISYPSVRASAASCLMKMTWHNLNQTNLIIIQKLSDDKHTFVREEICRNLRFLSSTDYPLSLTLAKKFLNDDKRLHFFLPDFLIFNIRSHTKDIFEICEKIVKKYGKLEMKRDEEPLLEPVVSLVTQMALKFNDEYFQPFFKKLVNDDSYNYPVKHTICFACKNENILFDEDLKTTILGVYHQLIKSSNHVVVSDAEFYLLHSLIDKKLSFLPDIKPLLNTLSNTKYDLTSTDYYKLNLIDYVEKFWPEIPNESSDYLYNIYSNNKDLTSNFHKSRGVIKLLEKMYLSDQTSDKSKNKILNILLEFVKIGWPEASFALKHLENSP